METKGKHTVPLLGIKRKELLDITGYSYSTLNKHIDNGYLSLTVSDVGKIANYKGLEARELTEQIFEFNR